MNHPDYTALVEAITEFDPAAYLVVSDFCRERGDDRLADVWAWMAGHNYDRWPDRSVYGPFGGAVGRWSWWRESESRQPHRYACAIKPEVFDRLPVSDAVPYRDSDISAWDYRTRAEAMIALASALVRHPGVTNE